MRDSERPLLRIPRPMGRHTCGTSPRRPTCHPLRGFRQRFFGLRRYCHVDPTAKFLSFLPPCAVIAVSSSTAFGGFFASDALLTALPNFTYSNRSWIYFGSPLTLILF